MLNRAVGGAYGYTTDIGGYFDVGPYSATTKELFIRWTQWAALSPMFRVHGSVLNGVHMPWSYDEETLQRWRALARLHRRAVPLIMRLWKRAKRTGIPITRPLWLAYPRDERAAEQDQQWMLGRERAGGPGGRGGRDLARGLLPGGLLARARWRALPRQDERRGRGAADAPALLHPLRHQPVQAMNE